MQIDVIPARRMPFSLPFLTYSVPGEIKTKIKSGQLVKIPFQTKSLFGIVKKITEKQNEKNKIKPISEIIFDKPVFSEKQIDFLEDISEFYGTSLGFLIKSNLLPLQKRKITAVSRVFANETKTDFRDKKKSRKIKNGKPEMFIYANLDEKIAYISNNIDISRQTLILAPELPQIQKIFNILPLNLQKQTVLISGDTSEKDLFDIWLDLWTGRKKIVVGTRRAIFLPWSDLVNIFLDDEGNSDYKSWDMAPRFHTRDAAMFLARHHEAKLRLLSHTPSVETFYFAEKKIYDSNISCPPILPRLPSILDLKKERQAKNYGFVGLSLVEEILKIKNGDVFIYLNRRGAASYVGCRDCGTVLRCQNCQRPLTFHEDKNSLECHFCGNKRQMITRCENCRGVNMAMFGVGTQMAEKEMRKITAGKNERKVVRVDYDSYDITKLNGDENKIIVGTQMAWPHLNWQRIKLLVFLDADTPLFVPEYRITEDLWQILRSAQYNLPEDAKIVAQTSHPEHYIFESLSNPKNFYLQELTQRKMFAYPPYKFLWRACFGHPSQEIAEKESTRVYSSLLPLTKNDFDIKISSPLRMYPYFHDGRYWQVILAKINYKNYKQAAKLLASRLPPDWKTDPNPNTLLTV
ncbi:MAG: primosomal protein N' [Patescibacteria group bacterium]